jgi:hypothetical protein
VSTSTFSGGTGYSDNETQSGCRLHSATDKKDMTMVFTLASMRYAPPYSTYFQRLSFNTHCISPLQA